MRMRIHGCPDCEHVALVGAWDPVIPTHEALYRDIVHAAKQDRRSALVVTLYPTPAGQFWRPVEVPPFNDPAARVFFQRECGIDTSVVVRLRRDEIDHGGAEYFLTRLCARVHISMLVLGLGQSLGRGPKGSGRAILDYCSKHNIAVRRLPPPERRWNVLGAREALRQGRVRSCVEIVGRPLYWSRPRGNQVRLPWPPGRYQAIPMSAPNVGATLHQSRVDVHLEGVEGESRFVWPDRTVRWLAFVEGPGDTPRLETTRREPDSAGIGA